MPDDRTVTVTFSEPVYAAVKLAADKYHDGDMGLMVKEMVHQYLDGRDRGWLPGEETARREAV